MTIFVVSGLRRSGTSMMMHILLEGGIKILIDDFDNKDKFNPNGYFEYHLTMQNMLRPEILKNADGMAVKVLASTIKTAKEKALIPEKKYKVIWMDRSIKESVKSWKLKNKKNEYTQKDIDYAKYNYNIAFKWLKKQKNIKIIKINYKDVIYYPEREIKKIQKFLGVPLDIKKAVKVIDKKLYRVRL